jgi:2-methylisocitrate lyase-like PEP mutase family enzyme
MVGIPGKSWSVAELEAAGVRRVSLATSLYKAAMTGFVAAAREIRDKGSFTYIDSAIPSKELGGYMRH